MNLKKFVPLCLLLAALFAFCAFSTATAQEEYPLGDVTMNGTVNTFDAAALLRHIVHLRTLSEEALKYADVNLDGAVNAKDVSCILRYCVRLDTLPPSGPLVTAPPTPVPTPTPAITPSPTPLPLEDKVVFLDAGHGENPVTGSVYGGGSTGYREAVGVLDIVLRAKDCLEEQGATVILTREDKYMVGAYQRMALVHQYCLEKLSEETETELDNANMLLKYTVEGTPKYAALLALIDSCNQRLDDYSALNAIMTLVSSTYDAEKEYDGPYAHVYFNSPYDETRSIQADTKRLFDYENDSLFLDTIYISVHTNAPAASEDGTYNPNIRGIMVYCMNNKIRFNYYAGYQTELIDKLGEALLSAVTEECGIPNKTGIIAYNDFFMIREHNIPAALIEVGYHTSPMDRAVLQSEQGRQRIALGITKAVCLYFGVDMIG